MSTASVKPLRGSTWIATGASATGEGVAAQMPCERLLPTIVKVGVPQLSKRNAATRLRQLPPAGIYMPANQNVQPSSGSTPMPK